MSENSLPPVINNALAKLAPNTQGSDPLSKQVDSLADGHTIRDQRPAVGANYNNTDHELMYKMITQHLNPSAVGASGQAISKAGAALSALQQQGSAAMNTSAADWQGESGDKARAFTAQLVQHIGQTGSGMRLVGTQMSNQAEAAALAKNSMPKPVPYDPATLNKQLQTVHNPVAVATQNQQDMALHGKSVSAQQHAAQVMNTYDAALDKSTKLPAFYAPPQGPGTHGPTEKAQLPGELDPTSYRGGSDAGAPLPVGGITSGGTAAGGGTGMVDGGAPVGGGFGGAGPRAGGESAGGRSGSTGGSGAAAEGTAARGGAASRGMGGPAGRGKKKEEDEDHYAPTYLVEPDPDEVFGCDIKTAPPVIGG